MENNYVSSTPGAFRLRWDVFLSFRGEDTRHFTSRLYESLTKKGIRSFLDDKGLCCGDEIAPKLLEAIEDSAAFIVIISENYANSRWCLEELAKIYDCRRLILPVFYLVDPSDVRGQRGPFEEDFRSHEEKFGEDKVVKWRRAMEKAGDIAGYVLKKKRKREEDNFIGALVERVLTECNNTKYIVGLDSRAQEVMKLLDVKPKGIRILGFHGIGGVGKTMLAKALFDRLVGSFKFRSFISNVRKISAKQDGLISLQEQLIKDLSPGKMLPVNEISAGITAIKGTVDEKQVLIVLDDVDNVSQLNALVGNREWFFEGSLIIITTRDREVLPKQLVNDFYEVRKLDSAEALQLFSYRAEGRQKPTNTFLNLSEQIVSLTGGLPIALEVVGSFLFDKKTVKEWEAALEKLERIPPHDLQDLSKTSFDRQDEQEKCIFRDHTCLFAQTREIKVRIQRIWDAVNTNKNDELISLDMVMMDEKNNCFHARVRRKIVNKFRTLLQEGQIYLISNFKLVPCPAYRPVFNDKNIIFLWKTQVKHLVEAKVNIPMFKFEFANYNTIVERYTNDLYLTDIVGILVGVGPIEQRKRSSTSTMFIMRNVEVRNSEGIILRVTLRGPAANYIDDETENKHGKSIVLVITSTIVKCFKGEYGLSSTSATKVYINLNIPETVQLSKSLTEEQKDQAIRLLPGQKSFQLPVDEQIRMHRRTITEITSLEWTADEQENVFTCLATITNIYGWCYDSCDMCCKKLKTLGISFWCDSCDCEPQNPIPSYKIDLEVQDSSGTTTFILFSREAERLIQKSANELRLHLVKEFDMPVVPPEIMRLNGKTFIFQIKITDYNLKKGCRYTVNKMFDYDERQSKEELDSRPDASQPSEHPMNLESITQDEVLTTESSASPTNEWNKKKRSASQSSDTYRHRKKSKNH